MSENNFVLKNKKNTIVGFSLLVFSLITLSLSLILFILNEIDIYLALVFFCIFSVPALLGFIYNLRLKIVCKDNYIIIYTGFFKRKSIKLDELSVVKKIYIYDKIKNVHSNRLEFYDKNGELIKIIRSFDVSILDEYNKFKVLLKENNITLFNESKNASRNNKANLIVSISCIVLVEIIILLSFIIINVNYNIVSKANEDELEIKELVLEEKEVVKNEWTIACYDEVDNYIIKGYMDFDYKLETNDNLEISFIDILGEKVIVSLKCNDKELYNLSKFKEKYRIYKNRNSVLLLSAFIAFFIFVIGYIFYYRHKTNKEILLENNFEKYHSVDLDGIHHYNIDFEVDEEIIKNNMLSKLILDGITIFVLDNDIDTYIIGYKVGNKKSLVFATKENDNLIIEDDLYFFEKNRSIEFLEDEKNEFINQFPEIERKTNLKPIFESDFEIFEEE